MKRWKFTALKLGMSLFDTYESRQFPSPVSTEIFPRISLAPLRPIPASITKGKGLLWVLLMLFAIPLTLEQILSVWFMNLLARLQRTMTRYPTIPSPATRATLKPINVEKRLSILFGLLIGGMWMGEVLLENLGGTSVLNHLHYGAPRLSTLAECFAVAALIITALGGLITAYRTRSIATSLRVGLWSGLISASLVFVTGVTTVLLFHDAMMSNPATIHEFSLTAHRQPTQAELFQFVYSGMAAHLFLGPLLGSSAGGIGAIIAKLMMDRTTRRIARG